MTLENLPELVQAGADVFVAGTLIFGAPEPRAVMAEMKRIIADN